MQQFKSVFYLRHSSLESTSALPHILRKAGKQEMIKFGGRQREIMLCSQTVNQNPESRTSQTKNLQTKKHEMQAAKKYLEGEFIFVNIHPSS
jgi:hypothetical protein